MIIAAVQGKFGGGDTMGSPDERASQWIGLGAFFLAAVICNGSLPEEMLPINRALFAIDCSLITAWLLLRAVKSGDGPY